MGFEYTSDSTSDRWLILSDVEQDMPTEDFKVTEATEKKSQGGKAMPILILKGEESGDVVQICAWKRDVIDCIKQYGGKPETWGKVGFERKGNRYLLKPRETKLVEEAV